MKRLNKYRGKGTQGVWSPVKCKACTDTNATKEVQVTESRSAPINRTLSYTSFLCDKCQAELSIYPNIAITQIRELPKQCS